MARGVSVGRGLALIAAAVFVSWVGAAGGDDEPPAPIPRPNVFDLPRLAAQYQALQAATAEAFRRQDFAEAERLCRQARVLVPHDPAAAYNLACALARRGQRDDALAALAEAVGLGFADHKLLAEDADLADARDDARFAALVARAKTAQPPPDPWRYEVAPAPIVGGEAWVREGNTGWDARAGVFRVFFAPPKEPPAAEIIRGQGALGDLLRAWSKEGTAAGNVGDLYDNHDGDHSNLAAADFPQLTRVEFADEARQRRLHTGLQTAFFHNGVVLGNSSTAWTSGPFWRSQPRLAYAQPRLVEILHAQYRSNHLYVYPEHRDHDAGHNGKREGDHEGHGDVYCANTPYVLISQGSSGSDQPFLRAAAAALAAFRPDAKKFLVECGALMPTLQMVFRQSYKAVETPADYLTGKAHPTVFEGGLIDARKMVELAHEITPENAPPLVNLEAVEEDDAVAGVDYCDGGGRQKLWDTPCALARVHRSLRHDYRLVVSAEKSVDFNGRPLTWNWVVLRGDPARIRVKPLNEAGSAVELTIGYHPRRPIREGSPLESNRVDVGVFVHNGVYHSAPGFVSLYTLDNETRFYNEHRRLEWVEYKTPASGGNYVDPLIDLPKTWRDDFHYDDDNQLLGWTRARGADKTEYTADGARVTTRDDLGRPLEAQAVRYVPARVGESPPTLAEEPTGEILRYEYASPADKRGRVKERAAASP